MDFVNILDERYPLLSKVPVDQLTPMMQQYMQLKSEYLDYILFYRLGDFYEMFFDDAVRGSEALEIALTSRGTVGGMKIPMCGVPYHALDTYLKRAFEKSIRIAICEQSAPEGKGIAHREVVRIITPGTVFNSDLLKQDEGNFIASIYRNDDGLYHLEFSDVSTGMRKRTVLRLGDLKNEVRKLNPAEVVYFSANLESRLATELGGTTDLSRIPGFDQDPDQMLQNYLEFTAKQDLRHIEEAEIYEPSRNLLLDSGSIRNLELVETLNGGKKKGSLLGVIDQTCTAMGARFLRESLKAPLLDLDHIHRRQDMVDFLVRNYWDRSGLRSQLEKIYDIERIVTKLVYDTIQYKDMVAIKNSLLAIGEIKRMGTEDFAYLFGRLLPLEESSSLIDAAITETGEKIRDGFSPELDEIRGILDGGRKWILELEQREKEKTNIRTLKISYNKVFGYYIEVSKSFAEKVPDYYIRRQTLVNSERFVTDELKELEEKVLTASETVNKLERQIFEDLKSELKKEIGALKENARLIAEIDLIASFAEVAYIRNYVRPMVDDGNVIEIEEGRHAVIETLSGYIPNDTLMNSEEDKIFVLTGPNMAGKSSYLRQNALIIIMAQLGSFVPATRARVGLVDRIFTRVGASDDLAEGRSTFMVEMRELAYILDHLTPRSFVILDEIGRGTSTFDGLSIALSVVEYLSSRPAKVMFATHYHELTVLEGKLPGVLNYRIDVKKEGDDIIFLRRITRGVEDRSYGIEVAMLAGVSKEVVHRAKEILCKLENGEDGFLGDHAGKYAGLRQNLFAAHQSLSPISFDSTTDCEKEDGVCSEATELVVKELRALDMDDISPKKAWDILSRLCKNLNKISD